MTVFYPHFFGRPMDSIVNLVQIRLIHRLEAQEFKVLSGPIRTVYCCSERYKFGCDLVIRCARNRVTCRAYLRCPMLSENCAI